MMNHGIGKYGTFFCDMSSPREQEDTVAGDGAAPVEQAEESGLAKWTNYCKKSA